MSERELWSTDLVRGNGLKGATSQGLGSDAQQVHQDAQAGALRGGTKAGSLPNPPRLSPLPFIECLTPGTKYSVYIISFNPHDTLHWFYYSPFTDKKTDA